MDILASSEVEHRVKYFIKPARTDSRCVEVDVESEPNESIRKQQSDLETAIGQ